MTETYWLPQEAINLVAPEDHQFELTGDHTGVTGVCVCGYVFTGVTTTHALFAIVKEHCRPIAADYL